MPLPVFELRIVQIGVFQTFLHADPFCLRKLTTDPHILAHVNIECPDDWYPKLKLRISQLILDTHKYMPVAYVTMHSMI
jgi:hypothetical protein